MQRSRSIVAKLAGYSPWMLSPVALSSKAFLAYWFYLRYKTDLNVLGGIFFGTNVLAPLSFLAVPAIARRFGLFRSRVMVISIEP
ncbi:MAG: hypothetical protein WCH75_26710 [Candidatus Binatia bacterium]